MPSLRPFHTSEISARLLTPFYGFIEKRPCIGRLLYLPAIVVAGVATPLQTIIEIVECVALALINTLGAIFCCCKRGSYLIDAFECLKELSWNIVIKLPLSPLISAFKVIVAAISILIVPKKYAIAERNDHLASLEDSRLKLAPDVHLERQKRVLTLFSKNLNDLIGKIAADDLKTYFNVIRNNILVVLHDFTRSQKQALHDELVQTQKEFNIPASPLDPQTVINLVIQALIFDRIHHLVDFTKTQKEYWQLFTVAERKTLRFVNYQKAFSESYVMSEAQRSFYTTLFSTA